MRNEIVQLNYIGDRTVSVDLGLPAVECAPKKCSNAECRDEEEQKETDRDGGTDEKNEHHHEQKPETDEQCCTNEPGLPTFNDGRLAVSCDDISLQNDGLPSDQ